MRLPRGHHVIGMVTARDDADLFCITTGGYGKRTPVSDYPAHKRGGQGVITIKDAPDRGDLVAVTVVRDNHELVLASLDGTVIRTAVTGIRATGRNTMGVRVMNLREGDQVASMARVVAESPISQEGDETDRSGEQLALTADDLGLTDDE
jgi:Type IIA topoisomerase (DNA gyrase/topo II, topoisomerase IV), A subunit